MRKPVREIKFLTPDEQRRLMAATRSSRRDFALFLLALRHGFRVSEVIALTVDGVDLRGGRIMARRLKGSLQCANAMDDDEIKAVKAWLRERAKHKHADSELLFPSERGGMLSRWTIHWLMKKYGEIAGLPDSKRHFHVLKHTCATAMLEAGEEIREVQTWLGHADIRNTCIYAQLTTKARDDKFRLRRENMIHFD